MKYIISLALLLFIIGNISAVDTESYEFIDHLLSITAPGSPEIFEDAVIFSASSQYKRVGIAFAHESFSEVYWFRKLMVSQESKNTEVRRADGPTIGFGDSGILFHTLNIPLNVTEISYRLIIDGLWTTDPNNPNKKMDLYSGLEYSVVIVPPVKRIDKTEQDSSGNVTFRFRAPPGETVTLAGSFNSWDPFMYRMIETAPGSYSLTLYLPAGLHHYVFYHRGQRLLDPINDRKSYTREGLGASDIMVE